MNGPYELLVGEFPCCCVSDGSVQMPTRNLAPMLSEVEFSEACEFYNLPSDRISLGFTIVLVDTGSSRVLIDTGMGPSTPDAGWLQDGLRLAGYESDEIDLVLISHGHIDHVGGLVDADGDAAFSEAVVAISRDEWGFMSPRTPRPGESGSAARARANLVSVSDRIRLLEPGEEVVPGVRVHDARGHTPGHLVVEVASGEDRLWVLGDLVFLPLHVEHPDWPAAQDHDPAGSVASRSAWLPRLAESGDLVQAFHMPFPGLGRVRNRAESWGWEVEPRMRPR